MKRYASVLLVLGVCATVAAYIFRGDLRDAWARWNAPKLPVATGYQPVKSDQTSGLWVDDGSPIESGVASSEHYIVITSPTKAPPKPSAPVPTTTKTLPTEANLDVPFTSQAPTSDWSEPYQNACEEASAIMVDAYYHQVKGKIAPDQAVKEISQIVDYENKTFGDYKDTDAADTAKFIKGFFGYKTVLVKPLASPDDIKRYVAQGYPVIVPADGKLLGNPNFRNGGPPYHMLVVKGYTATQFITNDPGTRLGSNYTYPFDTLMHAAHDWNGGDVIHGASVLIIILPN